ncbi:dihydrolipoyl dehydrogenase [Alkalihalophilus pseudofirmus]|nr:dihydrolipoyl dehydrogenase [Alkalihalophilus pseudofirmus]
MVVGDLLNETEVLVIGGGPGGYTAAIRAAQLGKEVTLVEKKALGGVCLNEGCIPSKALITEAEHYYNLKELTERGIDINGVSLDFKKFQSWKNTNVVSKLSEGVATLCKKNNVRTVIGEAFFIEKNEVRIMSEHGSNRYRFQHCIIASGSSPIELPVLPYGQRILSSTQALELQEIPKEMIIVGGGYIGIELGTAFAKLGTNITILEGSSSILPVFDKPIVDIVKRKLKKLGVTIYTEAVVKSSDVTTYGVQVKVEIDGTELIIPGDYCLVTAGRKPNTHQLGLEALGVEVNDSGYINIDQQCKTNISNIFAIGDIVPGPALAHKASYEGKVAAEVIAGHSNVIDYLAIPAVVFSDPEVAVVGLSEQQAKDEGLNVKVGKFPFVANGRALSTGETDGYVKIVADEDEYVLGVQIIGHHASNMIGEAALAIELGAKVEDICATIHAHPTQAEGIMEASEALLKKAIHMVNI